VTYFKVDDGLAFHPKMMRLSANAVRAWLFAGTWCGRYLTDGFLPDDALSVVKGSAEIADELVAAGLWDEVIGGYQFHDWAEYQYSKDQVERKRESDRRRKNKQRGVVVDDEQVSRRDTRQESRSESRYISGEGEGKGEGKGSLEKKETAFEIFWKTYPRKVGKQAALKAWRNALALAKAEIIIAGAKRLRDDPNREQQFTPHPATWLNQGRWDDEALPARAVGKLTAGEERLRNYQRLIDQFTPAKGIEA
jgi:hypothetical protein